MFDGDSAAITTARSKMSCNFFSVSYKEKMKSFIGFQRFDATSDDKREVALPAVNIDSKNWRPAFCRMLRTNETPPVSAYSPL